MKTPSYAVNLFLLGTLAIWHPLPAMANSNNLPFFDATPDSPDYLLAQGVSQTPAIIFNRSELFIEIKREIIQEKNLTDDNSTAPGSDVGETVIRPDNITLKDKNSDKPNALKTAADLKNEIEELKAQQANTGELFDQILKNQKENRAQKKEPVYTTETVKMLIDSKTIDEFDDIDNRINMGDYEKNCAMMVTYPRLTKVDILLDNLESKADYAYVDETGTIIETGALVPGKKDDLQSAESVLAVLFFKAGTLTENGVKNGDKLLHKIFNTEPVKSVDVKIEQTPEMPEKKEKAATRTDGGIVVNGVTIYDGARAYSRENR